MDRRGIAFTGFTAHFRVWPNHIQMSHITTLYQLVIDTNIEQVFGHFWTVSFAMVVKQDYYYYKTNLQEIYENSILSLW